MFSYVWWNLLKIKNKPAFYPTFLLFSNVQWKAGSFNPLTQHCLIGYLLFGFSAKFWLVVIDFREKVQGWAYLWFSSFYNVHFIWRNMTFSTARITASAIGTRMIRKMSVCNTRANSVQAWRTCALKFWLKCSVNIRSFHQPFTERRQTKSNVRWIV